MRFRGSAVAVWLSWWLAGSTGCRRRAGNASAASGTVADVGISRNAPCPCGSGRKYKRCCLASAQEVQRAARFDDEVGGRIQDWAVQTLATEFDLAYEQFRAGETAQPSDGRTMSDADVELFSAWFHYDRRLPGGDTPAERYAHRPNLHEHERAAAERIASARLSVHRVVEVRAGDWILLEDLASGDRTTVASANVSGDATRWDLLIGRVMAGDRPGLWGPTRLLEPSDEPDLLAEIERVAGGVGSSPESDTITRALETHPLDVVRFRPPSWDTTPTFFTAEGDLVAEASATWRTRDRFALGQRVRALGRLGPEEEPVIDITVARDTLVRGRAQLPRGAIVLEEAAGEDFESVPIATLRVDGDRLALDAMSEERLQRAVEIVESDFGDLVQLLEMNVVPIERRLAERRAAPPDENAAAATGLDEETERQLLEGFLTDRMRRWVDDSHPQLDGVPPREAASGPRRAEVVRLVRGIENGVDRTRRRGGPSADVTWLRRELGLEDLLAA
jgi:SEC-C motif